MRGRAEWEIRQFQIKGLKKFLRKYQKQMCGPKQIADVRECCWTT